jgi:hypothetical protein
MEVENETRRHARVGIQIIIISISDEATLILRKNIFGT